MFKNPFSFKGRIRRLEYGISLAIYALSIILVTVILTSVKNLGKPVLLFYLSLIPSLWFILSQGAKRCHDLGSRGLRQIVPFYNWTMLFMDGDIGGNNYGPNPKGVEKSEDFNLSVPQPIDDVDGEGIIKEC